MSNFTNYTENKMVDAYRRGQSFSVATFYFGYAKATRGYSDAIRSTVVSVGDTVIPTDFNSTGPKRMYRCTTAGTTGASEPTWTDTNGATVADGGTVVWTEMTADFEAGNSNVIEVSGGAYARVGVAASLANFSGTQGAGTTTASSGTGGESSNNANVTFPAPSGANWGVLPFLITFDASTAGNMLEYAPLTAAKTVNTGDAAPYFAAGDLKFTLA